MSKFALENGSTSQSDTKAQNGNDDTDDKTTDVKPKTKKRSASKEEAPEPKKKVKDSQKATTKSLNVPIDEGFNMRSGTFKRKSIKLENDTC